MSEFINLVDSQFAPNADTDTDEERRAELDLPHQASPAGRAIVGRGKPTECNSEREVT